MRQSLGERIYTDVYLPARIDIRVYLLAKGCITAGQETGLVK